MGIFDNVVQIARRTMVLFFVIDTSTSMRGKKIEIVNKTIKEVIPELKQISSENSDAQIKIAVLTFDTNAKWQYSKPVDAESFIWDDIIPNGLTYLGDACIELNNKLSRKEYMSDATGSFAPAIFLISDGAPTDNYKLGLDKLKENNWFKKAIKVGIALDTQSITDILTEFTGNEEAVITISNGKDLARWIKFVSVRASEIGSKSANTSDEVESKQDEFIEAIKEEKFEIEENGNDWSGDDLQW